VQVLEAIYFWARTIPERPAFIQPDGATTYRALINGIERAAEYFARNLPDRSMAIVVSIASPTKTLLACLGLLRANCSAIIIDPRELAHLPPGGSNTLVYERGGTPLNDGTNITFDESWLTADIPPMNRAPRLSPTKRAGGEIFFLTRNAATNAAAITRMPQAPEQTLFDGTSGFADFERAMLLLGVNSATGFTRACQILRAGKTLCFATPGPTIPWLINTYAVNTVIASPQQALALAELQQKMTRLPLAALRSLRLSGTALPADDVRRIKNHVCRNIIVDYSPQETGLIATAPHDMIADIPNAVGFVVPYAEVEIVNAEDRLMMQINAEGLVRVRTPQFLLNYQIEDSQTWFYTGNKGWLTDEGVLCIAQTDDISARPGSERSASVHGSEAN
jgi:acyl-CoA synthetase (AMP-forming)/AMP-acid ligase II